MLFLNKQRIIREMQKKNKSQLKERITNASKGLSNLSWLLQKNCKSPASFESP